MEIVHFPIHKEFVFAVATFPEGTAITHKYKRITIVKDSIGHTASRCMVADFDRDFKDLIRITLACTGAHIGQGIGRRTEQANLIDRNTIYRFLALPQ